MKQLVPTQPSAELIDEVVVIQQFDRTVEGGDELDPETLVKFIGRLKTYVLKPNRFIFQLDGAAAAPTVIDTRYYHYEIFVLAEAD